MIYDLSLGMDIVQQKPKNSERYNAPAPAREFRNRSAVAPPDRRHWAERSPAALLAG